MKSENTGMSGSSQKWIYFARQREPGLFRFPAQGGTPELVLDRVALELYRG